MKISKLFPKNTLFAFSVWIAIGICLSLSLRIIELVSILQYHSLFDGLIKYGILGWINDLSVLSLLWFILFPVYWFLSKYTKISNTIFLLLFSLLSVIHVLLLQYYAYMLSPLSEFFWIYFPRELFFTIRSANVNYLFPIICCVFALIILFLCYKFLRKIQTKKMVVYCLLIINSFFLLSNIYTYVYFGRIDESQRPYSIMKNKSQYFYKKTAKYFLMGNKTDTLINYNERAELFPNKIFVNKEYPLLSISNYEDVLSSYFYPSNQNPNIVIIIVEGLGERFMGRYKGMELMPFLNSIAAKSLYWKNVFSTSERSYGALSSILASAPYGERGFSFVYEDTTSLSIINLLGEHGYYSTFFYGQPDWFDDAGPYLRRNSINRIEHAYTYTEKYHKIMVDDYFWGYHDKDLVGYLLEVLDSLPPTSRIDIINTGSMHPPFIISEPEKYAAHLQDLIAKNVSDKKDIAFINQYHNYFETIPFTDDALKTLFTGYEKRPNYENTIFIITGDHNMNNIPIEDALDQYHVPLLIFSPRLKKPEIFLSINSHLDIVPTLLSFLQTQHNINMPKLNAFIGKSLDTCKDFRCIQPIPLMNVGRDIEMVYDNYVTFNNQLYQLNENLGATLITNDSLKKSIQKLSKNFIALNNYTYINNRLVPLEVYKSRKQGK